MHIMHTALLYFWIPQQSLASVRLRHASSQTVPNATAEPLRDTSPIGRSDHCIVRAVAPLRRLRLFGIPHRTRETARTSGPAAVPSATGTSSDCAGEQAVSSPD